MKIPCMASIFALSLSALSILPAAASDLAAIILPLTGQGAEGEALSTLLSRRDVLHQLGADQLQILIYDHEGDCARQVELARKAMDFGASVVVMKWGCDAVAAPVIERGGVFIDVGDVSPKRQPTGRILDGSEQRRFVQIGYHGVRWGRPNINGIGLPLSEYANWLSLKSSCDRLQSKPRDDVYGAYCYERTWSDDTIDRFNQYLASDTNLSDADTLVLAAVQVAAKISSGPDRYFADRADYNVDTVIGQITLGPEPIVLLPLRYIVDVDAADSAGAGERLSRIIQQICPDCAGSTKICGTKCPDECNNSCNRENGKQCCNKSGLPVPP